MHSPVNCGLLHSTIYPTQPPKEDPCVVTVICLPPKAHGPLNRDVDHGISAGAAANSHFACYCSGFGTPAPTSAASTHSQVKMYTPATDHPTPSGHAPTPATSNTAPSRVHPATTLVVDATALLPGRLCAQVERFVGSFLSRRIPFPLHTRPVFLLLAATVALRATSTPFADAGTHLLEYFVNPLLSIPLVTVANAIFSIALYPCQEAAHWRVWPPQRKARAARIPVRPLFIELKRALLGGERQWPTQSRCY